MKQAVQLLAHRITRIVLLATSLVFIIVLGVALWACYQTVRIDAYVRCVGITHVTVEKVDRTLDEMELSARNVFDEVSKHMDSPDAVIEALKSKTSLNPDVGGYFAAFDPCYFSQEKKWFEPYVHKHYGGGYELTEVGSQKHDYTQSGWYVRALETKNSFWSDPYYYDDGTAITGHYFTYVKPIFDKTGSLACVCGADMTFEWLSKELERIDNECKQNDMLKKFLTDKDLNYYSILLDREGNSLASPEGKSLSISDESIVQLLNEKERGVFDMDIDGNACVVYYAPLKSTDWYVAVVVPRYEYLKPMIRICTTLLLAVILGLIVIYMVCRYKTYEIFAAAE